MGMRDKHFTIRLNNAIENVEKPYYKYLTRDKTLGSFVTWYKNDGYKADIDVEWYYPDFFVYHRKRADEIKDTPWIRGDKFEKWYPMVLDRMESMGLTYYFVLDDTTHWLYYSMANIMSKYMNNPEPFMVDDNHYLEHIDEQKRRAYKIPKHLFEFGISKNGLYI